MTRVCVLGTSHVGALMQANRTLPVQKGFDWEFFPIPNGYQQGRGLHALTLNKEKTFLLGAPAGKKGAIRAIPLTGFDAFFLVGGLPTTMNFAPLLGPRVSARFGPAAITDICRNSRNHHVFAQIRQVSDAPVHVTMNYRPPNLAQEPAPPNLDEADDAVAEFWQGEYRAALVRQPPALLDGDGFTPLECYLSQEDLHLTTDAAAKVLAQFREVMGG